MSNNKTTQMALLAFVGAVLAFGTVSMSAPIASYATSVVQEEETTQSNTMSDEDEIEVIEQNSGDNEETNAEDTEQDSTTEQNNEQNDEDNVVVDQQNGGTQVQPEPEVEMMSLTQDSTKWQRFILQSNRCFNQASCDNFVSIINGAVNSDDIAIFHVGEGQTLSQIQIDALDSINLGDGRKGFEVFSLAEAETYADIAVTEGFGFLAYDLEGSVGNGPSPDAELNDPVQAFEDFKQIANAHNLFTHGAPERAITADDNLMDNIIFDTSRFHMQSQALQDSDTTCNTMSSFVDGRVSQFETWRAAMEGKLTFQVSFSAGAASGKTVYDTMIDCIDATLDGDVDGVSVWATSAAIDNTGADGYTAIVEYIQSVT